MKKTLIATRSLVALSLVVLTFGSAARDLDQDEALSLRRDGLILPLERLMQSALERYPGAVLLEVELEEEDDVLMYEVELVTTQGIVRELELDANSGQILKDEVED
ncbi:PepSY domain-containing protein [Pseudomonas borbori]